MDMEQNGEQTGSDLSQSTAKPASYKRIIICADGTWLSSSDGDKAVPSNVAKIARAISPDGLDDDNNLVKQIVYYHSGLGTGDLPLQKAIYGGLGWGLDNDVTQTYDFIANNYTPGDEIFFFGFSRGAFTVRSVAGLICDVGVLSAVQMSKFPEMWKAYQANTSGNSFKKSRWYLDNQAMLSNVRVKVIGVWDTVGALGIPEWPIVNWARKLGVPINKQYAFHNTNMSTSVDWAFQALAIDEKRLTFLPAVWHKSEGAPAKGLKQCWFPGVHQNIGGQYEHGGDRQEIGDNTFAWMVDNVSGMLTFEEEAIKERIEHHRHALNAISITIPNGWGCGKIIDNFAGLQGAFFRLLGARDRTPGFYPRDPGDGIDGGTEEYFHPMVRIRKMKLPTWDPPSTKGFIPGEPDYDPPWTWEKNGVHPLPEYVMTRRVLKLRYKTADGHIKYKDGESLARSMCPKSILLELDRENSIV